MISATMILLIGAALLFMAVVHIESPNVTRPIVASMTEPQVKRIFLARRLHTTGLVAAACALIGAMVVAIGTGASPDFMAYMPLVVILAAFVLATSLAVLFYILKRPSY